MITDNEDDDVSEAFLTALEQHKADLVKQSKRGELAGICMRWMLGTRGSSTDILLLAQVKNKNFTCDFMNKFYLIWINILAHPPVALLQFTGPLGV